LERYQQELARERSLESGLEQTPGRIQSQPNDPQGTPE
jgi:hypothetical protein